jgi:hypothetical protein
MNIGPLTNILSLAGKVGIPATVKDQESKECSTCDDKAQLSTFSKNTHILTSVINSVAFPLAKVVLNWDSLRGVGSRFRDWICALGAQSSEPYSTFLTIISLRTRLLKDSAPREKGEQTEKENMIGANVNTGCVTYRKGNKSL